jgi:hypothetical protein
MKYFILPAILIKYRATSGKSFGPIMKKAMIARNRNSISEIPNISLIFMSYGLRVMNREIFIDNS